MSQDSNKVLIGCPTSDYKEYALKEYLDGIKNLSYKNYDLLLVDNSLTKRYYKKIKGLGVNVIKSEYRESARERIIESRNIIREFVLNNGYDYFFSLEQDVIPPKDVIEKLMQHNRDVVSGVYFAVNFVDGKDQLKPLVWVAPENEKDIMYYIHTDEIFKRPRLIPIVASGLGCVLIKRKVLEKIKFRFDKEKKGFDDVFFGMDCLNNGFELYADLSIVCKHLIKNWSWKNIQT